MDVKHSDECGLVCRECGAGIEFELWSGRLGPLCERCYEKFDASSNVNDVRDAATGER